MPRAHPGQGQQLCSFFSGLAVRVSRGYLWESGPAGSSRPHPGTWAWAPAVYWGANPFETSRDGVWLGSTLSPAE